MIENEIELHEAQIESNVIELVVGEDYESIGTGQNGVLILADIENDLYEIALSNDTDLRKDCLARGENTNYIWRGGYQELVDEWVYVGPTIQGYEELVEQGCCKQGGCSQSRSAEEDAFHHILDLAEYGIGWLEDHPVEDPYRKYSIETLSHVISCVITQEITKDSTPTTDVVDMIHDLPDRDLLAQRLSSYILSASIQ